jgi:AhpD family alkylhydroperoxidase
MVLAPNPFGEIGRAIRMVELAKLSHRELIAVYTSWQNECQFYWRSHAAFAAEMLGSEEPTNKLKGIQELTSQG